LPVEWLFAEPTQKESIVSMPDTDSECSSIPSREQLLQLINYAEIGFMSAFLESIDDMINSGTATEAFLGSIRNDASQCKFDKVVHNLNRLINEYY
jgi:hypothetical protein